MGILIARKKRVQFNVSIALFTALDKPFRTMEPCPIMGKKEVLVLEHELELEQFFIDLKALPVEEIAIDKAFEQLRDMVKYEMRQEGLTK